MKILLIAVTIMISSAAFAGGFMLLHVGSADGSGAAVTGKILLVDGASFILQTDGTSKICLAGGC